MPCEFLEKLRDNDPESWDLAYYELWSIALSVSLSPRIGLLEPDAKEVAADVLRVAYEKASTVDSYNGLKALTCVIANRKATSLRRKLSADKRDEGKTTSINKPGKDGKQIGKNIPSSENPPFTEVEHSELLLFARNFIQLLEGKIKEVIKLKYLKGFSNIEISKKLDMNRNTVGVYLGRGISRLTKEANKNPVLMKLLREFLR